MDGTSSLLPFALAGLIVLVVALVSPAVAHAQAHSFTAVNETYSQDFDSLPNELASPVDFVNGDQGSPTLDNWYAQSSNAFANGPNPSQLRTVSTQGAGAVYSKGNDPDTERSLGSIGSTNAAAGDHGFGVRFVNNTGETITTLEIALLQEIWRRGADRDNVTRCYYRIGGTDFDLSLANPQGRGWLEIPELEMISTQAAADENLDGNQAANQTNHSHNLQGISIPDGTGFWLGWRDEDEFGIDHLIAIDNLSVTIRSASPTITIQAGGQQIASGGRVNALTGTTLAALNIQIDVSDPQAGQQVTMTSAVFTNDPGFTVGEWTGGPATTLQFTPSTGTFGTAGDITVTLTAQDDDVPNSTTVSFTIRVTDPLNVGDVVIIGYRTDATVGFSFVARVDLPAGLELQFTDDGANDTGGTFDGSESILTWVAPSGGITIGEVVVITDDGVLATPDRGSATGSIAGTLTTGGDQLFCFQGTLTSSPNLIFGVNFGNSGWITVGVTGATDSYLPTVLDVTLGNVDAGAFSAADNAQFTGSKSSQKSFSAYDSVYLDLASNWTFESAGSLTLDSTDFSLDLTVGTGSSGCAAGSGGACWWGLALFTLLLVPLRRRG